MKKLMILMAAVATSAFAFGEESTASSLKKEFDAKTAADLTGWDVPAGEGKAVLTNDVLILATGSDAARYWVNGGSQFQMGDNLYFDVSLDLLGQALDEVPTLPDGARLALFLLDTTEMDGAPAGTNLYALAKHPTGDGKVLVRMDAPSISSLLSGTSRLTVQTYKNVFKDGQPNSAFVLYQDGGAISGQTASPVGIGLMYEFKEDGTVNWKSNLAGASYLSGKLVPEVSGKKDSLLLSLVSNVEGQFFTSLDFMGNAKVQRVEVNDSGFDFIAADVKTTPINLSGVTISVDPASAYDAEKGTLSADCTITVTLNPGMEILRYTTEGGYLKKNDNGTFSYTYAEGNEVFFEAVAACATVNGEAYEKIAEVLDALSSLGDGVRGTLALRRDITADDFELDTVLVIGGDVTLDLAGKKIVAPAETEKRGTVTCVDGSLTIVDSATGGCIVSEGDGGVAVCSLENSTIRIEAGIFKGQIRDAILEAADEEAQAGGEETEEGEATTEEGAAEEGAATITIIGGSFSVEPDERLIAEGYVATQGEDGYWKVAQGSATEDGTETNPYTISTVEDLQKVIVGAEGAGKHYVLKNDLVLTEVFDSVGARDNKPQTGKPFSSEIAFTGVFDGQGHTISGVILKCGDYVGFFGSTYGATIKNLKIALGNATGFDVENNYSAEYCGGVIVGVAVATTIENCETVKSEVSTAFVTEKAAGGIVGFAGSGSVLKGCVNNLNLKSTQPNKAAGLVGCAQDVNGVETKGLVIDGCTNNGDVEGGSHVAGLVSYTDCAVTFKGANTVKGTLTWNGGNPLSVISLNNGSVTLEDASFVVSADYPTVNKAVDGLNFARVADGVVTLVADSAAVAGESLKVMAANAPVSLAKGESITLDETLATAKITVPGDCEVKHDGNTYTVTEKAEPPAVVDPSKDPVVVDSKEAAEGLTISATSPDANVVNDATYATYFKKVVTPTTDGKFSVAAVLNEAIVKVEEVAAELAGKFDEITDAGVAVAAKPGLFYSVEQGKTLNEMTEGERVMAKSEKVQLKATKFSGSGFYRILVNTSGK